ncbi:MAG: galactokinase [Nanoarchaeota archaeon]
MIITKTPLRISIAGGGLDVPAWYTKHGGMWISAAIDQYVYITVYRTSFFPYIHLKYAENETVKKVDDIKHDIIRETLRLYEIDNHIEIVSHSDIPSGTGLGSSGSFGVGLVKALSPDYSIETIAETATYIQMDLLKHPIGKQDQYIAAYGGIYVFEVDINGRVEANRLQTDYKTLNDHLVMFYTGVKRDANEVLRSQWYHSTTQGVSMQPDASTSVWEDIGKLGYMAKNALENNDFFLYGKLMNEHWEEKKKTSPLMTNPKIDEWYNLALENGAIGGKLVGAGGGGFLLFVTNDREKLINAMPIQHLPFRFSVEGTRILYEDKDIY